MIQGISDPAAPFVTKSLLDGDSSSPSSQNLRKLRLQMPGGCWRLPSLPVTLKLTAFLPLEIGRLPQKEMNHLPTIDFQGRTVSFRVGSCWYEMKRFSFSPS